MTDLMVKLWEDAATMDATLRVRRQDLAALKNKQIRSRGYSRARLFSQMAQGRVSLFTGFPVGIKGKAEADLRAALVKLIKCSFPEAQKVGVQTGPSRHRHRLKIAELMRRWEGGRAIVGVTDFHFRSSPLERALEFSALSDFDILCGDPEFISRIEMMSLVISSRGNLTDSHADDCDGSNHCFLGKKLWLAWDRMEGKAKGFQDVDRDYVTGRAAFDIKRFLSLPSACWFVVGANQTLFLPGSLAHKVITLEPYIGIGGFHVALPSCVRSLRRWILYDTLDIKARDLLDKINQALIEKIKEVQSGPGDLKQQWGLAYLKKAIADWQAHETPDAKAVLLNNPVFARFIEAAQGGARPS